MIHRPSQEDIEVLAIIVGVRVAIVRKPQVDIFIEFGLVAK